MKNKIDLNKFKEVVGQLKARQRQIQGLMNMETLNEAKKYAETSKNEIQRLIQTTDVKKVKALILKEAAELRRLQASVLEAAELRRLQASVLEAAEFIQKKIGEKVSEKVGNKVAFTKKRKPSRKPVVPKAAEVETALATDPAGPANT
ncbi:hypothetical protein EB061_08450 [bacterium]|nr:hypothetical protein [bacterium]